MSKYKAAADREDASMITQDARVNRPYASRLGENYPMDTRSRCDPIPETPSAVATDCETSGGSGNTVDPRYWDHLQQYVQRYVRAYVKRRCPEASPFLVDDVYQEVMLALVEWCIATNPDWNAFRTERFGEPEYWAALTAINHFLGCVLDRVVKRYRSTHRREVRTDPTAADAPSPGQTRRTRRREYVPPDRHLGDQATAIESDEDPLQRDLEIDSDQAIRSLSDRDQEILRMRIYEGRTIENIARTLGMNPGGVRARLSRATEILSRKLRGYRPDSPMPGG
jgi:RNA polymerase sigma factor (sigma-70 family)